MLEYQTTGIINVNGGYIGLDEKQAGARRGRVKPTKDAGVYEVVRPVQFKAGEKIRLANPDKTTLSRLDQTERPQKKKVTQSDVQKPIREKAVNKK